MQFYLGTCQVCWLERTTLPLFISRRRFTDRRRLPRALGVWALDSGGFTELSLYGKWQTSAADYVRIVRRLFDEIGNLAFASPRDYMCEPFMIEKTGLSVAEHQKRTVEDYQDLIARAPDLPFIPVLQGWTFGEYLDCLELYDKAGVDLTGEPLVGLGSVCRRQHSGEAAEIVLALASRGLKLHGFGFKTKGLPVCAGALVSADSMAWSLNARKNAPLAGCTHKKCSNCLKFAEIWREKIVSGLDQPFQPRLF